MTMKIDEFNQKSDAQARELLMSTCHCQSWVELMLAQKPFASYDSLLEAARTHWRKMEEKDWLEAFRGHPKIGDLESLKKKFQSTAHLAGNEQGQVAQAPLDVLKELARLNDEYEKKFGFIFIVCASGKSAEEMLALLKARIIRDRRQELKQAAEEQEKITQLRLEKMLCRA